MEIDVFLSVGDYLR